jgi:predicted SAM-dependent methyltransferase
MKRPHIAQRLVDRAAKGNTACVFPHMAGAGIKLAKSALRLDLRLCSVWMRDLSVWLFDSFRLVFLGAHKVQCDCCGWQGHRFFLYTIVSGRRVQRTRDFCPRCHALERQRQLVRHLRDKTHFSSLHAPTILDIGPSKAVVGWFRRQSLTNIITIDLRPGIAMLTMDVTKLGLKADVFDLIVCSHVLEHLPDDLTAMREILRVLKEKGICLFQVPIQAGLLETVEYDQPKPEEHNHLRAYGEDFESRLSSAGFEVRYAEGELFEVTKPYSGTGQPP